MMILTIEADRQRNAEDLLMKVSSSRGWATLDVFNRDAAHLLRKYGLVSFPDGGRIIHLTPKGAVEVGRRAQGVLV